MNDKLSYIHWILMKKNPVYTSGKIQNGGWTLDVKEAFVNPKTADWPF